MADLPEVAPMKSDSELIAAVLRGDSESFESLIRKYQPRVFATARRYARREDEVEDIVQEIFIKAFQKLSSYRGDAPFEHWLMRLAVHTCYDFLRMHQRKKENSFGELSTEENDWLEHFVAEPSADLEKVAAAKALVDKGVSAEMITVPDGKHGFPKEKLDELYPSIFAFLKEKAGIAP